VPSSYDPSITQQDAQLLQFAYSQDHLVKLFADLYGPSIAHKSLRYAVCAYARIFMAYCPELTPPEEPEVLWVQRAISTLARRLPEPDEIDEGDLFCSFLLARCHSFPRVTREQEERAAFSMHVNGVLTIMRHLSNRADDIRRLPTFRSFWLLIRDVLIQDTYVINPVGDIRFDDVSEQFKRVIGQQTTADRKQYQSALGFKPKWAFASAHFLLDSLRQLSRSSQKSALWETLCVEIFHDEALDIYRGWDLPFLHRPILYDLEILPPTPVRIAYQGPKPISYDFFRAAITFYLRDVARRLLESQSLSDGVCSQAGQRALMTFFAYCKEWESIISEKTPVEGTYSFWIQV
jgi:hypothetical protein